MRPAIPAGRLFWEQAQREDMKKKLASAVTLLLLTLFLIFVGIHMSTPLFINGTAVSQEEFDLLTSRYRSGLPQGTTAEMLAAQDAVRWYILTAWAQEMGVSTPRNFADVKREWREAVRQRQAAAVVYGMEMDLADYYDRVQLRTEYEMRQVWQQRQGSSPNAETALQQFDRELENRIENARVKGRESKWI